MTQLVDDLDWDRVRSLVEPELANHPHGPRIYADLVTKGMARAHEYVLRSVDTAMTVETIRAAHALVFREVHSFAGHLRATDVHLKGVDWDPPFHAAVIPELERIAAYVEPRLGPHEPAAQRLHAIALYQVQFKLIQPFVDGNTRVAWCILNAQLSRDRGLSAPRIDREAYGNALRRAVSNRNLDILGGLLTPEGLPPESRHIQYPMECWPIVLPARVAGASDRSIRCHDTLTAKVVAEAVISPRLADTLDSGTSAKEVDIVRVGDRSDTPLLDLGPAQEHELSVKPEIKLEP